MTMIKDETAFADAISAVFAKYPEARGKYHLASLELFHELGIDFATQIGVSRIEGDRIITEFQPREDKPMARMRHCDIQNIHGDCLAWSDELPK